MLARNRRTEPGPGARADCWTERRIWRQHRDRERGRGHRHGRPARHPVVPARRSGELLRRAVRLDVDCHGRKRTVTRTDVGSGHPRPLPTSEQQTAFTLASPQLDVSCMFRTNLMTRICAVAATAAAGLVAFAAPALAAPTDSSEHATQFSLAPAHTLPGVPESKAYFIRTVRPGGSFADAVLVHNL